VGKKTTPVKEKKAKSAAKACKTAGRVKAPSSQKRADKQKATEKAPKGKTSQPAVTKATVTSAKTTKTLSKASTSAPVFDKIDKMGKTDSLVVKPVPKTTKPVAGANQKSKKANSRPLAPAREPREISGLPKVPAFRNGFDRVVRHDSRPTSDAGAGGNGDTADDESSPSTSKTYLSDAELEEFRQLLIAKRQEIIRDVTNLEDEAIRQASGAGASSSMPIHMADLGTDTWEQELTLGLIENERNLLREIDEALERVNNKTYGMCLATNKRISKARLQAKPWAKYCIEYARKRELGLA
jgi:RNA polymerase-binding protein DksA